MQALRSLFIILWMWPVVAWAQDFWVGHFEDDGEEFQDVPHGLVGAPKALFIWADGLSDPEHEGGALSWSICDRDRCLGWSGDRIRVPLSGGGYRHRSRRVSHEDAVHFIDGAVAELVGWDSRGIGFRWHGDQSFGRIHILAIGGEKTQAKVVDWNLPASTPSGRVEVSGVGFEPDVLISLFSDQALSSIPLSQNGMSLKMGVATREDLAQWTTGTATNTSGDSLVARWLLRDSFIAGGSIGSFPLYLGKLAEMTADGFVVDFPATSGVRGAVGTLALSGVRAQAGAIRGPSSSGSALQEFTGMRFRPQAMVFRSVQSPRNDTAVPGASLGLGMTDGERSSATAFREAPLGSVAVARGLGVVHLGLYDAATGGRAALGSFNENGFTLGWEEHLGVPVDLAWLALATTESPPAVVTHEVHFTREPGDGVVGEALAPVEVRVQTEAGELVSGVAVRLELLDGAGVSLGGTLEVSTVEGVARFSDLVVDGAADGLRLRARALEASAVSAPFDVRHGAPAHYRVACGCGAGGSRAAFGWGSLFLALWWGARRRPRAAG